jgi:hypothetical protein
MSLMEFFGMFRRFSVMLTWQELPCASLLSGSVVARHPARIDAKNVVLRLSPVLFG